MRRPTAHFPGSGVGGAWSSMALSRCQRRTAREVRQGKVRVYGLYARQQAAALPRGQAGNAHCRRRSVFFNGQWHSLRQRFRQGAYGRYGLQSAPLHSGLRTVYLLHVRQQGAYRPEKRGNNRFHQHSCRHWHSKPRDIRLQQRAYGTGVHQPGDTCR